MLVTHRQVTAGTSLKHKLLIEVPEERTGSSHVLPAHTPALMGSVASRIRTVATISLSATGSRKAPNGVEVPCIVDMLALVRAGVYA